MSFPFKHEEGLLHKEVVQEVHNDIGKLEFTEDFEEDFGDFFILLSLLPSGSSGNETDSTLEKIMIAVNKLTR